MDELTNDTLPPLNFLDLELLHNFATATAMTISNHPTIKTMYRVSVPKLAFSCDYVCRAVLAFSALHMAYLNPERSKFYMSVAIAHHNAGLKLALPLMQHVTTQNAVSLYLFSTFTTM